jgi:integrase
MTSRRSRGEGGLRWEEARQRWVATVTVGYDARGKRIIRKRTATTKTAAKDLLKNMVRDLDDGHVIAPHNYTVAEAVRYWLEFGLSGRSARTAENYRFLAEGHIVPALGRRQLRDLSVDDIDRWLAKEAKQVSTRTLRLLHSILNRSVKRAQVREKVKRNVVMLCEVPTGTAGRPSKSMTLDQAETVLKASEHSRMHAYIVLSLLIGARTEELRALKWQDVDLDGDTKATPPVPPSVSVLRAVREGGDTKTRKSRRRLAMPLRCVEALRLHQVRQEIDRAKAGKRWQENCLVFASTVGTELNPRNVSKLFREVLDDAGMAGKEWTPREMRHSFVSLLSDSGVPIENISRLVGHSGTAVTELVYRFQIRPVLEDGATAMNEIFPSGDRPAEASKAVGEVVNPGEAGVA